MNAKMESVGASPPGDSQDLLFQGLNPVLLILLLQGTHPLLKQVAREQLQGDTSEEVLENEERVWFGLSVRQNVPRLCHFVLSQGTRARLATGSAPSFLHLLSLAGNRSLELSLSNFLTASVVRSLSEGPPDSGVWTWPWENPSVSLLKIVGKFNASLSVEIWDQRNTDVSISK